MVSTEQCKQGFCDGTFLPSGTVLRDLPGPAGGLWWWRRSGGGSANALWKSVAVKSTLKVCLSTLLLAHPAGFAADAAQEAAGRFYHRYLSLRTSGGLAGLPSPEQMLQLSTLITPQLRALLVAAYQEQMRCKILFPEDVPPWMGGDLFSSNVEGFTVFDVAPSRARPWGRAVSVRFTYGRGLEKIMWTDSLVLNRFDGAWLVDDVDYRAAFAFTSGFGTHLQGALKEVPAC